jgi:hypothetical protein
METTIVFLDPSASASASEELRRRQLEEKVMTESTENAQQSDSTETFVSSTHNNNADKVFDAFAGRPTVVPGCFVSQNVCETVTSSCSGHGMCVDRWGKDDTDKSCFFCLCEKTLEVDAKGLKHLYRWGGSTCRKRDISTPFWLFAGVTIALVATVAFSIGLLFSVGEEKLPGVIGAGVSRTK